MRESKHFINGEYLGSDEAPLTNYSPVTGEQIGIIHNGGVDEVNMPFTAAQDELQGKWGQMSVNGSIAGSCGICVPLSAA